MADAAWVIAALPLAAWLIITFIGQKIKRQGDWIAIGAMAIAFVLALGALFDVIGGNEARGALRWVVHGEAAYRLGFAVDPLTAVMLVVVTFVSLMVQIYSLGYMHGDVRYKRYYGVLSLFTFSMLGLVLADNFLFLFIFWELVGLCSYLLIGHWYEKAEVGLAALKAFITTRVGDIGLLVGIMVIFAVTRAFGFDAVAEAVESGALGGTALAIAAILIFAGAVGKSAQFPLHAWLPDAMAGPTPVSALIHAATMVAAGVYLVARTYMLFEPSPVALSVVAWIGAFTALFAASMALVMEDIKKVLAYSTISQLGFMMLGLGVGGYGAGLFHLTTHAFFKALLFLGAGSVIHAAQTQNMHEMGGLFKKMPVTGFTWLVGAASLAGIPPLSGYFSKDEIMVAAWHSPFTIPFWMGEAAALFTAFYITRATFLTFFGAPRVAAVYDHAHESPRVMTVPLLVLAIPAAFLGFANSSLFGHAFSHFLRAAESGEVLGSGFAVATTTAAWMIGLGLAVLIYGLRAISRRWLIAVFRPIWVLLKNRYYVDHVYDAIGAGTVRLAGGIADFDRDVIDGAVRGVGALVVGGSRTFRRLQTGVVQSYALVLALALVVGIVIFAIGG